MLSGAAAAAAASTYGSALACAAAPNTLHLLTRYPRYSAETSMSLLLGRAATASANNTRNNNKHEN